MPNLPHYMQLLHRSETNNHIDQFGMTTGRGARLGQPRCHQQSWNHLPQFHGRGEGQP